LDQAGGRNGGNNQNQLLHHGCTVSVRGIDSRPVWPTRLLKRLYLHVKQSHRRLQLPVIPFFLI
jgi:hypothetical protein